MIGPLSLKIILKKRLRVLRKNILQTQFNRDSIWRLFLKVPPFVQWLSRKISSEFLWYQNIFKIPLLLKKEKLKKNPQKPYWVIKMYFRKIFSKFTWSFFKKSRWLLWVFFRVIYWKSQIPKKKQVHRVL